MPQSITTSIRLSIEIDRALKQHAKQTHLGKNKVIVNALKEYLAKHRKQGLIKEARKQSILASKEYKSLDELDDLFDDDGWEA